MCLKIGYLVIDKCFLCPILLLAIILLHAYNPATTKFIRAILVVLLVSSGTWAKQLLSSSLALRINKMSYQLYLVHASVLASFCSWFSLNLGGAGCMAVFSKRSVLF